MNERPPLRPSERFLALLGALRRHLPARCYCGRPCVYRPANGCYYCEGFHPARDGLRAVGGVCFNTTTTGCYAWRRFLRESTKPGTLAYQISQRGARKGPGPFYDTQAADLMDQPRA